MHCLFLCIGGGFFDMDILDSVMEMIGVLAFAVSGALVAVRHRMDLFGVIMLGIITALGGGVIRDVILGIVPPSAFQSPVQGLTAAGAAVLLFLPVLRRRLTRDARFDALLQSADAVGLGIFTVHGLKTAVDAGFGENVALLLFVAVITGVGGGILRDLLAGERPAVFVRHIYATASLAGAVLCVLLRHVTGLHTAMYISVVLIVLLRLGARHFRWNLPKAELLEEETK